MQFCISHPSGAFICFARALVFEGSALTYNPTTNQAEWVPVRSTVADLSPTEERSALALCNLVLCDEEEAEERMDRFGERRDAGGVVGDGTKEDPSQETPCAKACCKDEMEMDEESGHQEGDVVSHPEVDDDTEVDVDMWMMGTSKVTQGPRGKACIKAAIGEKGVNQRMRSLTPSPNSQTLKLKWGARKNFCKHCHPPCGRS